MGLHLKIILKLDKELNPQMRLSDSEVIHYFGHVAKSLSGTVTSRDDAPFSQRAKTSSETVTSRGDTLFGQGTKSSSVTVTCGDNTLFGQEAKTTSETVRSGDDSLFGQGAKSSGDTCIWTRSQILKCNSHLERMLYLDKETNPQLRLSQLEMTPYLDKETHPLMRLSPLEKMLYLDKSFNETDTSRDDTQFGKGAKSSSETVAYGEDTLSG